MTATDVQKILNLKHAWEFILDGDVIASCSDYYHAVHGRTAAEFSKMNKSGLSVEK